MVESIDVSVAAIGAIPVIVGSVLAYRAAMAKERLAHEARMMKREMDVVSTSLSAFGGMLNEFSKVEEEIRELCAESEITRVMVLCAWNGRFNPKWTTAVWQYRQNLSEGGRINKPVGYVHLGLDGDYVDRLVHIKKHGSAIYRTEHAPDSLIKKIYEADGVIESLWVFLSSSATASGNSRLMTYMSFASQVDEISPPTKLKCELLAARLAPLTGKMVGPDES